MKIENIFNQTGKTLQEMIEYDFIQYCLEEEDYD